MPRRHNIRYVSVQNGLKSIDIAWDARRVTGLLELVFAADGDVVTGSDLPTHLQVAHKLRTSLEEE